LQINDARLIQSFARSKYCR